MNEQRFEIVDLKSGEVVHAVPCPNETPGTQACLRTQLGIMNHIGKFDCRLSRGGDDVVDDRLDLDRYFIRFAGGAA